ncbi:hypothetical protein GCM10010412_023680 [Nonomuraea recticatena]|uniref:Uncharacterized protein n=1 Tax=Nonomuraea recticatena TaxID=46178 RepID=A0ABP6E0S4_9ACTN
MGEEVRVAPGPSVGWRGSGERVGEAADALFAGRIRGKIVLDVT